MSRRRNSRPRRPRPRLKAKPHRCLAPGLRLFTVFRGLRITPPPCIPRPKPRAIPSRSIAACRHRCRCRARRLTRRRRGNSSSNNKSSSSRPRLKQIPRASSGSSRPSSTPINRRCASMGPARVAARGLPAAKVARNNSARQGIAAVPARFPDRSA